jgi:purine-cytosine permease-like protein
MVDHDNPADGDLGPEGDDPGSIARIGPRRSTWTPPPSRADGGLSDDELADALAEDLERAIHHETPFPVEDAPAVDEERPDDDDIAPDESPAAAEPPAATEPPAAAEEPTAPSSRPVRRSLPMSELASTLAEESATSGSTLDVMARLEEQLRLREQDAADFDRWQSSVLENGSPEALAELEAARSDFSDILGDAAPATPAPATPASGAPVSTDAVSDAAAEASESDSLSSHIFRLDEVHDDELSRALPPMTAPISDIPPPPGHELAAPATPPVVEAAAGVLPEIPDLVEPAVREPAPSDFDFDSLLSGASVDDGTEPAVFAAGAADGDAPGDSILDDDVADTDQAFGDLLGPFPVTSEGVAILPEAPVAPVEPMASPRVPTDVHVVEEAPTAPPAFQVESSSVEPTPTDRRVGRAARLFWLWFAVNSSVVSVAFGGAILSLGMSLRQAILSTLFGVVLSFLPLGLGTLAGKWSGQPTMIVSRATFGHLGNILPSVLALVVRVFWGAVLLWFLAAGTARILTGAELAGGLGEEQLTMVGLAIGLLLALVIAFFGYGLVARIQLVFTIVSALLVVGLIVVTWPAVDISTALTVGDGPWILLLTGTVLVFSFVGLVWAVSSGDLARYQRPGSSGAASMLWSTFGATIPAFVLVAYGALLAASDPVVASGLIATPLDTIALLIPIWYPVPLIAALALSLLSGVVLSLYSGGFALQAVGTPVRRHLGVVIIGVLVAGLAVLIALSVGDFVLLLRDVATTLAVPVAAWAGIFAAEMMIRNRPFDSGALLKRGGVYRDVNWVNLAMLVVASVVGFGLTTASVAWLGWEGYLFGAFGIPLSGDLAASDLGVLVALGLGLLTPIVAGIPGIRRQEQARR